MLLYLHLLLFCLFPIDRGDFSPPRFNVSLEVPAEQRWEPVLKHYDAAQLRKIMQHVIGSIAPKWVVSIIELLAHQLSWILPQPYETEIQGLSKALDLSLGEGLLINLAYELSSFCTSIVVQDTKGNIYHGRNLDYAFSDALRSLTVDLQFVKNGQIVYTGTTFIGFVGLWTGQRPNKFTISGNARVNRDWWRTVIAALFKRSPPPSWLIRDTLLEAGDFQAALKKLAYSPITADVYYILGGVRPTEGVIITRNLSGPVDIWPLIPMNGQWYRVETNYDHWKNPPPFDDRRTPAVHALNTTGQNNINLQALLKILTVKPVLNKSTVYTTLMCAAQPYYYRTLVRT
ncbi:N-acylethanolamine-hydrolyzing acid amidase-like isoform X2 [Chiloscyllium plagiosum]|uniref:N-acylethanolamine-hydrolyzing acid amidase-like isoform X2 n=1 Tax=Chiloscyllium plagiosum TaxID=36176 RepID=UPI001CB87FC1|nr:N-acylethanolamine-hydrolyzing acid amidase-like isoform X2 [Chiloscyllium plagiosum]